MFEIITTKAFEKQALLCHKRGYKLDLLQKTIAMLEKDGTLPPVYKAHTLSGNLKGHWECHIKPDWLLVWDRNDKEKTFPLSLPAPIPICLKNKTGIPVFSILWFISLFLTGPSFNRLYNFIFSLRKFIPEFGIEY